MSHFYYDFNTLQNGTKKMVDLIQEFYTQPQGLVSPEVKPGFLRNALPENPPENGESIQHLIERTKSAIMPGIMNWQSPKYFGYYPSSVSAVCVLADMFAASFHTPNFSYAVAPSYTELQNTMMDWSAKALGLPEAFLIKNSGGGIINNSASESVFVSAHVAKFKKLKQLNIQGNNPDLLKLVGYFGQGSHISSQRALLIKDIYYRRSVPYVYNKEKLNYELDYDKFEEMVEEDIKQGLIPFWFGGSWGNTFSAAIDLSQKVVKFCKKHGIWINVDAAFLGSTWICEQYRPQQSILQSVDSININFSKLLLTGTVCLFYVNDKKIVSESFGAKVFNFAFFKNHFTQNYDIIDYKDWIVGLGRRNNALKLYYNFIHYGLNKIRDSIVSLDLLTKKLIDILEQNPNLFQIHTIKYSLVLFQVKDKEGKVSNELTKSVAAKIKNCAEGYCSPSQFQGNYVIRIVVGNFHTTEQHITKYINKIIEVAKEHQSN